MKTATLIALIFSLVEMLARAYTLYSYPNYFQIPRVVGPELAFLFFLAGISYFLFTLYKNQKS
jgi:hypothetical protein